MRTRQRRKRKGEGEKEEDEEEKDSDEEAPTSLLQQLGERVSHKYFGKHFLSVANLDGPDVALFVVAAGAIKKTIRKWKESQQPAKTEEDSGEMGEETHVQHSPRTRRQASTARRRKAPRSAHSSSPVLPETATLLAVNTLAREELCEKVTTVPVLTPSEAKPPTCVTVLRSASSVKKGETLDDTVRMLGAYADAIVLRHPDKGSAARAAAVLDARNEGAEVCCLVNAGDGTGEHPTQALLDLFTIAELFPEWWSEQLQRLMKNPRVEDTPSEKGTSEDQDEVKKENKGGEMRQEREGQIMDSLPQEGTVSHTTEGGSAVGGGHETAGLLQRTEETEGAPEKTAAAPATAAQSSSSQDTPAKDTAATDGEKKLKEPWKLTVAFVGDLKNGRTVHSLALLLSKFNCRIITLSSPDLPLPVALEEAVRSNFAAQGGDGRDGLVHGSSFTETIGAADVLYMTRTQTERFGPQEAGENFPKHSRRSFTLTRALLEAHAKPHLKVLHPLPRLDEIDTTVDTTPFCAYFTQAANGVFMRMALLAIALNPHTWQFLCGM